MTSVIELLPYVRGSRARLFVERMCGIRADHSCYFSYDPDGDRSAQLVRDFKDIEPIEKWGGKFLIVPSIGLETSNDIRQAIKVWQDGVGSPKPWFEFAF